MMKKRSASAIRLLFPQSTKGFARIITIAATTERKKLRLASLDQRPYVLPLVFGLSFLFVVFIATRALQGSLQYGRLSIPPTYDDVVYLYWSQAILQALLNKPLAPALYQIIDQHSPLTTIFGAIGYFVFGNLDIGPYIVATAPLTAFVMACILLLDGVPILAITGIVCAIGSLPMLGYFATEYRPEPAWAVLTATAAIAPFAIDLFHGSRLKQVALGLWAGLAVISKPTTSPVTMTILAVAFLSAGVVQVLEQRRSEAPLGLRSVAAGTATVLLCALVIIVPVGAIIGREIYDYVTWVLRDISSQVKFQGDFSDQALFYLRGAAGEMLGKSVPVLLAIWVVGVSCVARLHRAALPRISAVLLVILTSYVIPSASTVKLVWFGAAFYSFLIIATVYLVGLLYRLPRHARPAASIRIWLPIFISLTGVSLVFYSNFVSRPGGLVVDDAARADVIDRTSRIWSVLKTAKRARIPHEMTGHISNVMTIAPEPIAGAVISLYAIKEDLPIRAVEFSYARSIDEVTAQLGNIDYVVAAPSLKGRLSGAMLGDSLLSAMSKRSDFFMLSMIHFASGQVAYIYERTP